FQFSEPSGTLLCQLELTLPPTLSWTLLPSYDIGFGALAASFTPDPEIPVVTLVFASTVTAEKLQIPITLSVSSIGGDWTLAKSSSSRVALTPGGLSALAGNQDILSIVPSDFTTSSLELSAFQVAFNPTARTCSLIHLGLAYLPPSWTFFDG